MNIKSKHRTVRLMFLVVTMVLGVSLVQPLWAATQATFYVSPSGDDSNRGTFAAPFLTIQKAQEAVRAIDSSMAGDIIVYLRAGMYPIGSPLVFNSSDSGTNGFHVIYRAYENEVPVISGGVPVTGWTLDHGKIYRASLHRTTKLRSLFVNGARAFMASSPNPIAGQGSAGAFTIQGTEPWALNGASGSEPDDVQFNSIDVQSYANPDDVELVQNHGFNSIIVSVRDICLNGATGCNETNNLYTDFQLQEPYGALAFSLLYGTNLNANGSFYIQNAYELLKSPGQFYFDRATQTLYYDSRGEDMSKAQVIAPTTEGLLQVHGNSNTERVKNLEFVGITFAFDHWQMYDVAGSTGMAALQSVAGQVMFAGNNGWHADVYNDTQTAQASIDVQNADSITFQRDSFQHLSSGIALSLTDDVINSNVTGNSFVDLSGNSVNVGNAQNAFATGSRLYPTNEWGVCTNDTVQDNYIRLPNRQYYQFEGLSAAYVNGLQLLHNDMARTGYTGISLGWGWVNTPASTTSQNNTVDYNRLNLTNQTLNGDGGAMYTLGQMPNSTVSYNYVLNSPDEIYPDQGSSHINFTYNVLRNSLGDWLYLWNATAMPDLLIDNTYTDTVAYENAAAGTPSSNDVVSNTHYEASWDSNAQAIIKASGLETKYRYLRTFASITGLTASRSNKQITLTWQATGVATSFNIYRSTSSIKKGATPYQVGVAASTFTDSSVTPGSAYYYEITAVGPKGESAPSAEFKVPRWRGKA